MGIGFLGGLVAAPVARADGADDFGPLQPADANGLQLPPGFTSRSVAVTGSLVGSSSYTWHAAPDGGATFAAPDGGWVYVSNSEIGSSNGGVGAIRFASDGTIVDAYSILAGTTRNCAGGATPWGTWLSCEETGAGEVYECDPFSPGSQGVVTPALGVFNHEAVAVDPVHQQLYLTEDRGNGLLYRFTPTSYPDLSSGLLEVASVTGPGSIAPGQVRSLSWTTVPDPSASSTSTRYQVPAATTFDGGEGCWYEAGAVYFSTKGDNRVWRIDTAAQQIEIVYDLATTAMPFLSGVDNVFAAPGGDVYVAEDGGNLEIVALTQTGLVRPIVRLTGVSGSEITGPALSPDGTRLYFSSQRNPGETFEVTGPFLPAPAEPVPSLSPVARALLAGALALAPLLRRAGKEDARASRQRRQPRAATSRSADELPSPTREGRAKGNRC